MANFAAMKNLSHSPRSSDRFASFARQAPLRVALCALLLAGCTTGGPQGVGDRAGRQDPATVSGDVSAQAVLKIAESLRASGDLPTAISFYRRAIQADPNQIQAYVGLGETLLAAGYANQAADSFRAALAIDGNNADAMRGLGMTLVALDKPVEAVEMLNKSLKVAPSPRTFSALGVADNLIGNTAAALDAFKQGLATAPDDLDLLNNYGLSQALAGDYDGAIATLHRVATDPRATARNRLNLALVLGLAGRSDDAARVARIDLDEKSVRSNLAYYAELRALSPQARAQAILRPGKPLVAQTVPAATCDNMPCPTPALPSDHASAAPSIPVASSPLAAAAPQKPAAEPAAAAEPKTAAAPKPAKHAKKLAEAKPKPAAEPAKPHDMAAAKAETETAPDAKSEPAPAMADAAKPAPTEAAPAPAMSPSDKPVDPTPASVASLRDKPADMASASKPAPSAPDAAPMMAAKSEPATPKSDAAPAVDAVPQQLAQLEDAPAPSTPPAAPETSSVPAKQPDAAAATSTQNAPQPDQAPAAMKWLPGPNGNTVPATAESPSTEAKPSTAQASPASKPEFVAAANEPKPDATAESKAAAPESASSAPADHPAASGPTVVAAAPVHPSKHGSWIQLATFRSEQNAKDQLKATTSSNQDLLHDLPVTLRRVDLGAEKGVYYLLRIGPMANLAQAHDLCSALKDRKIDCIVAK